MTWWNDWRKWRVEFIFVFDPDYITRWPGIRSEIYLAWYYLPFWQIMEWWYPSLFRFPMHLIIRSFPSLAAHDNHDLGNRYGVSVTNDHGYVPFVVITIRSFPHSWLITGFVTRVTRWVSYMEQELFTLSEHLSSPPGFSSGSWCSIFSFPWNAL